MSRICVKNLPKHVDEKKLREVFSEKGAVTDAKLLWTPEGNSRQLAFIGFRTEDEANEAIKHFHRTFIGCYRISCEPARRVGDPAIPRPWSRHTLNKDNKDNKDNDKNKNKDKEKEASGAAVTNEDDHEKLKEFLEVMQPRAKSKLWANDTVVAPGSHKIVKGGNKEDVMKNDEHNFFSKDNVVSDMDYFKSRVNKEWSDSDSESSTDIDNDEKELEGLDPCRLFIRNLPYTATEDELEKEFSRFGSAQVHLVIDKETNQSKGIAFLLYTHQDSARSALKALDGSTFQGRLLHVMPAKLKNPSANPRAANQAPKSLKQQREEKKKAAEASGDTRAWNSFFIRPETAVDIITRKYGVSKREFLDADDAAVRVAQAQTHVIALSKKALAKAGVNVESLEILAAGKDAAIERSNHIIFVKNLPAGCTESELSNIFGKFGSLDRVVMPSTKTFALIVFFEPSGARAAYTYLHYRKYRDIPLYLEWPPANILSPSSTAENNEKNNVDAGVDDTRRIVREHFTEGIPDYLDSGRLESRTLYVKNLNFKTSDESLKMYFSEQVKEGRVLSAKVKKHLKNGKNVSMGFGFVEFDSVETAQNVCKDLQKTILEGHQLILQHLRAKQDEGPKKVVKYKSSKKLIVKNVPFESTKKDLLELFGTYGKIKGLRLPQNMLGQSRGFAFVEFATKQEAENAIKALPSSHLLYRHLVLERAKEGESLEELRARTGAQLNDQNVVSRKKKAVATLDEGNMEFERLYKRRGNEIKAGGSDMIQVDN